MTRYARFTALFILVSAMLCGGALHATQPFWSMEPSTEVISRADSLTGFDITKYTINLSVNDQSQYISGQVIAEVTAEENLSSIEYRLMGGTLAVDQVLVNGSPITNFTHADGIIHIPLSMPQGAQFTTSVSYSGFPGNSPAPYNIGLKFTTNGCYTLSNPDAGRYWWPSYDHPWDKALVDWNITVRGDWLAAANGIRTGITVNPDGTRTHHWVCSSPVATFVIGFAAAPYVEFTQQAGDLPIKNFVLAGQLNNAMADFANVPMMIAHFSELFGPYPFEKYGHMVVNMSTYAAMEHQTMTTFGSQYLNGQQTYESIVAHELAHQWYGNYVTPLTMREVWLKESFATYSEALWVHRKSGWQAACDYVRDEIQQYYISWENSNGPHTIFNPVYNLMFAPPTYEKSASVMHMLRLKMGNAAFFNFIRQLVTDYANSNLITAEFIALAQQHSGQDLQQFFQQWIYSPGIPNAEVCVFTGPGGQAKAWGRSISPTATQFYLDIPLRFPGSAVADSVVVSASPAGSYTHFTASGINAVQVDPQNWVLARQKNQIRMQMHSCLPYNGAVAVAWSALAADIPLQGYHVWRRQLPSGTLQQVTSVPVQGLQYTDTGVLNGINYEYYVTAVDTEGYQSLPSNAMTAMPIDFPFDMGFLVVDETRDGNGSAISPNDQMADDYYAAVLQNFHFTQWDMASQGAPALAMLSHYPLVLWHADDFSELLLLEHLDLISSYVLSGGKLVISGWKYPSVFSSGFMANFLGGVTLQYHNSAVLISAQSEHYPVLLPDPAKLAGAWNGMLPMTYTFAGAQNALYTANLNGGGVGHGDPAGVRVQSGGTMVLLGFPLYFMQEQGVRGFLNMLLPELHPAVAVDEHLIPSAREDLKVYPNPMSGKGKTTLKVSNAVPLGLEVYNIRGQKLAVYGAASFGKQNGEYLLELDPAQVNAWGSGCYILRLRSAKGDLLRRVMLIK